jgi:integrase
MDYNKDFDYTAIISKADISEQSKKVYLDRVKTLTTKLKKPLYWILKNPKQSIEFIFKISESENTRKSYISAILAIYKHNSALKNASGFSEPHKIWVDKFNILEESIQERYKENKPSEKQLEGYVPYEEIVKKRDELPNIDTNKLLLGMYTYIKPLRADFNAVALAVPADQNYIDISNKKLVLQEYKTKKNYNKLEIKLPDELLKLINDSLKESPRDFLFVDRTGKPYSANSFIKWANRRFLGLFKKPLTITLIRHSYISSLDQNKLSTKEKEKIALEMGHTKNLQDLYRFI